MKIKVSDDAEHVEEIRQKIKNNGGYCCCKLVKTEDTKCICKEFLEQTELGECHCGLYIKVEN